MTSSMFIFPRVLFVCVFLFLLLPIHAALEEPSTTVIDILSQNVEFSYFLRLLQKNLLIPYLNELSNITLIAPVNSAFVETFCSQDLATVNNCLEKAINDFDQDKLSSYIVKAPISSTDFEGYRVFHTVFNKEDSQNFSKPIVAHIDAKHKTFQLNKIDVVDPDLFASSQGSYVQGIDKVFTPKPLQNLLKENGMNLSIVRELLKGYPDSIDGTTIFLPTDEAVDLESYQINYLLSKYGESDRRNLLNSLIIDGYYAGDVSSKVNNRNGFPVKITSKDSGEHIILNETLSSSGEVGISSSGLFHFFSNSSLLPRVEFDPLKTLVGLGASAFVDELVLQDLSYLITNNSIEQTIFYAKDASLFSIYSKSSNLYHFVDEKIEDLSKAKSLYGTRFCNRKKFGESCQKIKIESVGENSYMINNNVLVEAGPFKVGNTVIYLTDDNFRTPNDFLAAVNPSFHCTKSLNLLSELKLAKFSNNGLGYTIFLPCYDSYRDFDLTLNYLKKDRDLMDRLLRNFILEGLVYSDLEGNSELYNLNHDKVLIHNINHTKNGNLRLKFNNESLVLKQNDDILFNQGVIHPVKKMLIPKDIEISLEDIVKSSVGTKSLFFKFLEQFDELKGILATQKGYSVLLPSSFKLKQPFETNSTLEKFLKLHIIPKESLIDLYTCDGEKSIRTLDPKVNLTCSKVSDNNAFLSIDNGAENGVNIFARGCTNNDDLSCVYLIDKPISLKWIDGNSHNHISLPGIALGVGILLGSLLMVLVLSCLMLVILRKRKSSVTESEEEAENATLIQAHSGSNTDYHSTSQVNNFEAGYSDNTNVDPINFPTKKTQVIN